jgi:hypothetical protein
MEKIYQEGKFKYLRLVNNEIERIRKELPVEYHFVSEESCKLIKEILNIDNLNNEELQALRNSVVRGLSNYKDIDTWVNLSMVTGVIDHEKVSRGMEV